MAGETQDSSEYIQHHITNLTYGQFPNGSWGFAHSAEEAKEIIETGIAIEFPQIPNTIANALREGVVTQGRLIKNFFNRRTDTAILKIDKQFYFETGDLSF